MLIQRVLHFVDDIVRHLAVDVPCEFDKSGFDAGLLGLPRKIERIDGNAMPAKARSGEEWHKTERLGGRGFYDFPNVDIHPITHDRNFIDEANVNHAESILE